MKHATLAVLSAVACLAVMAAAPANTSPAARAAAAKAARAAAAETKAKVEELRKQISTERCNSNLCLWNDWFYRKWATNKDSAEPLPQKELDAISDRYIELYEHITGEKFVKEAHVDLLARIEKNVTDYLK